MPKWTKAERDTLRAAVASGVLTVSYDGPPKRQITYQSLAEMRSLLAEMDRQIAKAPTYRRVWFSKGFRR